MKNELCISRTTGDKAMERQVELSRGNRFEEQISLTMYDAETENEVGFIHGTIYFADVLSEFCPEVIRRVQSDPLTDEMTRSVLKREYTSPTNRNVLMLAEPIAVASYISQEDVLEALQEFVESFYGYTLHAIYSYKFPDEKLPHYQSDGRQYVFYPGEDITDVEGLHFYEYEL